jgi:hypothetical protein
MNFFEHSKNWYAEKQKAIDFADFHASYGKRSWAKEFALEVKRFGFIQDEYREKVKETLLSFALYAPGRLREIADALCSLNHSKGHKCPRGGCLLVAYARCNSFPPTFSEVKQTFIATYWEKKWNGGNVDDQSHGDFSARKTLKALKLPLAKSKLGRPIGKKSVTAGAHGLKESKRK